MTLAKKGLAGMALLLFFSVQLSAQADSAKKAKTKIRPYAEVITASAVSQKGLFMVHQVDERWYFEIPLRLLQRDMMVVSRIAEAAADMRMSARATFGYSGDPIGGAIIRFEKGPNNKVFIRRLSFTEYARDSTSAMYAAVKRNTLAPIIASFPVTAVSPDSSGLVVDVTDYLNGDNELFNFGDAMVKMMAHVGAQQNDKSYLEYVHVYPENVEVRSVKTYAIAGSTRTGNFTLELNGSLILLPEVPMKSRYFDERVGYFTTDYLDYDADPQGVKEQSVVNHWRLEPRPEDRAKYLRGELVEPAKPIVFYIDPATPKKWVPYLIQGVNDWNAAFEKAGFRNAISARPAPTKEEDPGFSLEDARHSALVYKPSPVPNASGPNVADPRSGEILESHINWYHNVMTLIRNWYMIQCGAVDPRARKMELDDDLMGELIRFVSSHEVGHTLGLRHNFGSSSTVSVDSLRSRRWLDAHGHTPSIMDYARFNYVAQPEDSIPERDLFPRIGDYDYWAIEWGYRWYDTRKAEEDVPVLNRLVMERLTNPRLWFGSEASPTDPRSQNEDLGDDAMKAGEYGIKNLQRILPHLADWTRMPNEDYTNLTTVYKRLNAQFDQYIIHVIKNIAGVYVTPKTVEQRGPVYEAVPVSLQRQAVAFLDKYVLNTPLWLGDRDIMNRTGLNFVSLTMERQGVMINSLLGIYRMSRMIEAAAGAVPGKPVYTLGEFLDDLDHAILRELYSGRSIDAYRRNLQKIYIGKLLSIAFPPSPGAVTARSGDEPAGPASAYQDDVLPARYSDIGSTVQARLRTQLNLLKQALPQLRDRQSRYHVEDMIDRVEKAFKEGK